MPSLPRPRLLLPALAMHSVRLGQLYRELEQRELDALEEVRSGLNPPWEE